MQEKKIHKNSKNKNKIYICVCGERERERERERIMHRMGEGIKKKGKINVDKWQDE